MTVSIVASVVRYSEVRWASTILAAARVLTTGSIQWAIVTEHFGRQVCHQSQPGA